MHADRWVEVPPRDTDGGRVRTWLLHATSGAALGTQAILERLPDGDWWFVDVADLRSGRGRSAASAVKDSGSGLGVPDIALPPEAG